MKNYLQAFIAGVTKTFQNISKSYKIIPNVSPAIVKNHQEIQFNLGFFKWNRSWNWETIA